MKDSRKGYKPGLFSRDAVRDIVTSLYYVGFITYAGSAPLSMQDDLEHPERIPGKKHHSRRPEKVFKGLHEQLYPFELWMENQQTRAAKAKTPTNAGRSTRIYLLSDGIGFCWECFQHGIPRAGLRGSINGNGRHSYRCATLQDRHKSRGIKTPQEIELVKAEITPIGETDFSDLVELHSSSWLPADHLESQAEALITKLILTPEIKELVMAYYLSDDGMGRFLLERKNLFLRKDRILQQHRLGLIDDQELEMERDKIQSDLKKLTPETKPEAREILPMLEDFPQLWKLMTPLEKRTILKDIFAGLYFDGKGRLVEARPHPIFAGLL